jgi:hypothetical protein
MTPQQALAIDILNSVPTASLRAATETLYAHGCILTATDTEIVGAVQCDSTTTYRPSLFSDPDGSHGARCDCRAAKRGQFCRHVVFLVASVLRGAVPRGTICGHLHRSGAPALEA